MTVLDGEASQWNRSRDREAGDRSRRRVAGGDPLDRGEVRQDRRGVGVGGDRTRAGPRRGDTRAPRNRRGRHRRMTPAFRRLAPLDPRHDADDRVLELDGAIRRPPRSGTLGLLDERPRRREPSGEVGDVGRALRRRVADDRVVGQPVVGDRVDEAGRGARA